MEGSAIDKRKAWFFAVDAGRARFLECSRTDNGRVRVEERAFIENHREEHEHSRPSPRVGKGGHSYASTGHEADDQRHRFAKQVVQWMEQTLEPVPAGQVDLFSAPKFLGELRKLYGPELAARLKEHQADLTQLSPSTLAKHPAVEELVS